MFIERIPEASKKAYLQKIVDQYNNKYLGWSEDEMLFLLPTNQAQFKKIQELGYDQKIADLNRRNIYFDIYQNSVDDAWHNYSNEFAFIAAFSDTAVKTTKAHVGYRDFVAKLENREALPLRLNLANTFQFIDENQQQLTFDEIPEIDNNYIKEFMLPNLRTLDKEQGTHLVEAYKIALGNKFAKKRHLIIQNLQKQQDDLGLENC